MPTSRRPRIPKYRHYKPKNLGVVRLNGKDIYLGKFDSAESWEKYHALIAEWLADGGIRIQANGKSKNGIPDGVTVNQVMLAYMKFAASYYVRDGQPTREIDGIKDSLRPLRRLFGSTLAGEFGPIRLKAVRQHMIGVQDLCRREINKRIGRVKRMFCWAVSEELIPPSVFHGLQTVKGLRKNRTKARESTPVKPVSDQHVDAVLPYLPPQIIAMINLQRVTGARPGEIVIARPCDIDMTRRDVWIYTVPHHKTEHHDFDRFVVIGPKGQEILQPFMSRPEQTYLFSPEEAYQWRLERRQICYKRERKTPIYPCELRRRELEKQKRRRKKRKRPLGEHYTARSYWKALDYGFKKAAKEGNNLTRWHPNQLRHSRATELRKRFGIEATRVSLGHARLTSTEIYAEKDLALAIKVAKLAEQASSAFLTR